MIQKGYRYLSACNEYCEVNMKLIIGNLESGTGNRKPATGSLFLIEVIVSNSLKS